MSYLPNIPSDSLLLVLRPWLPPTLVLTTVLPTLLWYPINVAHITLLPLVLASLLVLRHRRRRVLRRRLLSRVCCRTARPSRPVSFLKITFHWIWPFSGPFFHSLTWDIFVGAFLPGGTLPHWRNIDFKAFFYIFLTYSKQPLDPNVLFQPLLLKISKHI